jgi:hypothetical protein
MRSNIAAAGDATKRYLGVAGSAKCVRRRACRLPFSHSVQATRMRLQPGNERTQNPHRQDTAARRSELPSGCLDLESHHDALANHRCKQDTGAQPPAVRCVRVCSRNPHRDVPWVSFPAHAPFGAALSQGKAQPIQRMSVQMAPSTNPSSGCDAKRPDPRAPPVSSGGAMMCPPEAVSTGGSTEKNMLA